MRATVSALAALLLSGVAVSVAAAQPYPGPYPYPYPYPPCVPQAPDACGPGFYAVNPCGGCVYGPVYCVRPPWEPFNGFRPGLTPPPNAGNQILAFPTHPYARSPRDYFMQYDR